MRNFKAFISNFLQRSGNYVIGATIISRILSFIASWVALQLIPNREFGIVLFAYNIILFITPLSGLGLYQSLIRYAPLLNTLEEKKHLFNYVLSKGIKVSFLMTLCIVLSSIFVQFENSQAPYYVIIFSCILIPEYMYQLIKIRFRILHQNKKYSFSDILYNIILIILIGTLSGLFQEKGYVFAIILTPLIASSFYIKHLRINKYKKPKIVDRKFWQYGIYAGLTSVVSQLLVSIDILLIGLFMFDTKYVTDYRYISLIPMSMLFMSNAFMATDFVTITERVLNKDYLFNYIKNYIWIFSIICSILLTCSYFFGETFLNLFDSGLVKYANSFFILTIGISSILILRGLFGNLLSSIGKVHINLFIAIVAIAINTVGNYKLIPTYGITGVSAASAFSMIFTSIVSSIAFLYYYKLYLKENSME